MDKRGLAWKEFAGVLLAVVALVALVLLAIKWYESFGTGKYDPATCRTSVELHYSTKLPYIGKESPFKLKCETKRETSETLVKRQVLEEIARDMYACWWQFGEGEIDFLSDIDWFGSDLYCRICSIRRYSSNGFEGEIPLDDLQDFLDNEKIPTGKVTYSEFFTKVEKSRLDLGDGNIRIDTQNNFYVLFVANKKSEFWKELLGGDVGQLEAPAAAAGGAAGRVGYGVAARKVATALGTKASTKLLGPVGIALVGWDVYALGARATEFYPALLIASGSERAIEILQRCDDFE
ncbi:MAG: hypothetical protein ABIB47_05880 [Candidatus Woesearchaeota archaeon]